MGNAKPITPAGRTRVEEALVARGLLLIQGQWEIPSVADLLEGGAVTTRGYSWDYVPAWDYSKALADRPDVGQAKLFRGRSTLIERQLWFAVNCCAADASRRMNPAGPLAACVAIVRANPGIPGGDLRSVLNMDAKQFQRTKTQLEQRLQIFGVQRDDVGHHTHESAWYPWSHSKIAKSSPDTGQSDLQAAVARLTRAIFPPNGIKHPMKPIKKPPATSTLLPVLKP